MPQQSPSRTSDKVMIRLPDGMRAWINEEAKRNLRSANAHIVWLLQQVKDQGQPGAKGPTA